MSLGIHVLLVGDANVATLSNIYLCVYVYMCDSVIYMYLIYTSHNCTLSSVRKVRKGKYLRRTVFSAWNGSLQL